LLDIEPGDYVLEIGPGGGVLTRILAEQPIALTALEIDRQLATKLANSFESDDHVTVINTDLLEFDFSELDRGRKWKVIGNLPYNVTTPILQRLFENHEHFQTGVFTVQREVADRLTAEIGSSSYSSLTVFGQCYSVVRKEFNLKPGSFFPPPKVSSSVITIEFLESSFIHRDRYSGFNRFVQEVFSHRRKTILNGLQMVTGLGKTDLQVLLDDCGVDPAKRPQNITVEQFASIFDAVREVADE
jgi:16S rRNA (adenine1518-N6/adenine1519-N6)-dimethyltransferase